MIKFVVSLTIINDNPSLTIVNDDLSLTIVNDDPSLTIVNDDPSLTIVNIIVNKILFQKRSFSQKRSFFKKQSFSKMIAFKNARYSFSKSSKRVGRRSFFPKTKRSFLKTKQKRSLNDHFQKRLTTLMTTN